MNNKTFEIREQLLLQKEEKYKLFIEKLIPGCNNIIGVRIPTLRKMAKEIIKDNPVEYLRDNDEIYFEEVMLKGLIIGNLKEDIDVVLELVKLHIPKINNWSLCDSFCSELKIVTKNKEKTFEFLKPYLISKEAYEIRFGVVLVLFKFIEESYIERILEICDNVKHEDYYVKMAVAWCLSMCFIKYEDKTMDYLKDNNLDKETYNKTLQKIRESLKVDKEKKEIIKSMKR